jgi:hypothetical protein
VLAVSLLAKNNSYYKLTAKNHSGTETTEPTNNSPLKTTEPTNNNKNVTTTKMSQ